jgi:hypothetical protein
MLSGFSLCLTSTTAIVVAFDSQRNAMRPNAPRRDAKEPRNRIAVRGVLPVRERSARRVVALPRGLGPFVVVDRREYLRIGFRLGGGVMAFGSLRCRFALLLMTVMVALPAVGVAGPGTAGAAAAAPVVKVSPSKGLVDLQKVTISGTGFSANIQLGSAECRPGALAEADCDLGTVVYAQTDQHGAFTLVRYVRRLITVAGKKVDCGAAVGCIIGAASVANLKQDGGQKIFFNPKIPPKVATIAVSPNTKLVDHQLVTVSGTGYAPSTTVYVSQCLAHPPAGAGQVCDYSTQRYVTVDSHGAFTATNVALERRQTLFTRKGTQTIDCAAKSSPCVMEASATGIGGTTPVEAPLSFSPFVKFAVASVQLTPSLPLQDLELVTLTGTGFTPGYAVNAQECAFTGTDTPACDYTTSRAITTGYHGEFTLSYYVRRDIVTSATSSGPITTDCAAKLGACELTIQGTPSQPTTALALNFDPSVPAVTATITAAPGVGLTDNQSIGVSLQGFTPNQPVQILECSADAISEGDNLGYCDYTTAVSATPTGPGGVQAAFAVRAIIGGQSGLVDCTAQPGACVLIATENGGYSGVPVATPGPALPNFASTALTFSTP